ncbi:MAG: GAF domain-containing protein [Acidobacteriota bacterium]
MDEPEEPEDEPVETEDGEGSADAEVSALAELALCENLSQTSGWAARWSASMSGADAALLWAPDTVHPLFLCIGAHGDGFESILRRSAPRESGIVHDLVRDRGAIALDRSDIATSADPFLRGVPSSTQACLAVPLEAEGIIVGLLALFFQQTADTDDTLQRIDGFLQHAAPALGRALRSERKTVGMLHAIERLTNLYDLSKAFGSTIDTDELATLIVHKAADFASAEVVSMWLLEGEEGEVSLAATAANDNYDVEAPAAVGASVVGDVIADQTSIRRNRIPESDPVAGENEGYTVRSILAVPLIEDEVTIGALALVNKRGRHPEFSPEDEELLQDLSRQAVRALRTVRQHEAERKVEELDALLAVSREITATLDLDKVMKTIVNATSALIAYDRCGIAILEKGKLRLGAISGSGEVNRKDPEVRRMEELLQWLFLSGTDTAVTQLEDGQITADRPETEEKFRALFEQTGLRSFFGVLLKDEEGKLGALAFESKEPMVFDEGTRDLLAILVNQATVAVRNAQLYQQVPLAGFWGPLLRRWRRLVELPRRRRMAWGVGLAIAAAVLFLVPWRLRVSGPARILPGQRGAVTAGVGGVIASVLHHEGDRVAAGEVIATLKDEAYRAGLAEARGAADIAESEIAKHREEGDAAAMFSAQSRRDEFRARVALAEEELARTRLQAPMAGVIVTPRIEERVGQVLARGAEFCVVADAGSLTAEVAVPEGDIALVRPGQPAILKLNTFPTRTFGGVVTRLGARLREQGDDRFLIAEVRVDGGGETIRSGMLGVGKIRTERRSIAYLLVRRPARYLWAKIWPMLP